MIYFNRIKEKACVHSSYLLIYIYYKITQQTSPGTLQKTQNINGWEFDVANILLAFH